MKAPSSTKSKKFGAKKGSLPSFGFGKRVKQGMKGQAVKYGSS